MGRKVLGGSRDRKTESFMEAAGMRDWVIGVEEIGSLPERRRSWTPKSAGDFGEQSRRRNRQIAEQRRG